MSEQNKDQVNQDAQLSDEALKDVAGGKDIHKRRLEALDTSTKSVENIQQERLDALDARDSGGGKK